MCRKCLSFETNFELNALNVWKSLARSSTCNRKIVVIFFNCVTLHVGYIIIPLGSPYMKDIFPVYRVLSYYFYVVNTQHNVDRYFTSNQLKCQQISNLTTICPKKILTVTHRAYANANYRKQNVLTTETGAHTHEPRPIYNHVQLQTRRRINRIPSKEPKERKDGNHRCKRFTERRVTRCFVIKKRAVLHKPLSGHQTEIGKTKK